jgi:hypothetical protein
MGTPGRAVEATTVEREGEGEVLDVPALEAALDGVFSAKDLGPVAEAKLNDFLRLLPGFHEAKTVDEDEPSK